MKMNTDRHLYDTHADICKKKVLLHRPGGSVPPAAAFPPAVTGPAGWHWWDQTDWSTREK